MAVIQPRPNHILDQCAKCEDDRTSFNVIGDVCDVEYVTIQWRIAKTGLTISFKYFAWEPASINNIKTRASREMTSRTNNNIFYFNFGECCQTLACDWARYLPSLIALLKK